MISFLGSFSSIFSDRVLKHLFTMERIQNRHCFYFFFYFFCIFWYFIFPIFQYFLFLFFFYFSAISFLFSGFSILLFFFFPYNIYHTPIGRFVSHYFCITAQLSELWLLAWHCSILFLETGGHFNMEHLFSFTVEPKFFLYYGQIGQGPFS